ncbi:hypothetical protein ACFV08_29150, partial [Streptomyces fradiae]
LGQRGRGAAAVRHQVPDQGLRQGAGGLVGVVGAAGPVVGGPRRGGPPPPDRIVVLDGGRVEAIGTHAALTERSAVYARLVAAGGTGEAAA